MDSLKIIQSKYLDVYKKQQPITLSKHFKKLKDRPIELNSLTYWAAYASVYSSMIEGNNIDFDTYLKFSKSGMNTNNKSMCEIEDLMKAYEFASSNSINKTTIFEAHKTLSKTLVDEEYRGVIRNKEVYIFGDGQLVYTGASPDIVIQEMNKLFEDIKQLKQQEMNINEIFYYASMIHLVLVKIHPFADGNGRLARLIEKWFLADKLGKNAWYMASEKLYRNRLKSYYKNLDFGENYEYINFDLCIPFLKMLPMALSIKN